jgi:hypothetical protein
MSLNKLTATTTGFDLKLEGGFDELKCNNLETLGDITLSGDIKTSTGALIPADQITSGLCAGLETKTITSTALESFLFPTLKAGTLTVPANTMKAGDSYHIHASGLFKDEFAGGNPLDIFVNMGSGVATAPINTLSLNTGGGVANTTYNLDVYITVRETGAPGVAEVASSIVFTYQFSGGITLMSNASNITTFDTTIDNDIQTLVQWTNASANSEIGGFVTTLTKVF